MGETQATWKDDARYMKQLQQGQHPDILTSTYFDLVPLQHRCLLTFPIQVLEFFVFTESGIADFYIGL